MCDKTSLNDDELRDLFAAFAISGILSSLPIFSPAYTLNETLEQAASSAFHLADAMVKESNKRRNT